MTEVVFLGAVAGLVGGVGLAVRRVVVPPVVPFDPDDRPPAAPPGWFERIVFRTGLDLSPAGAAAWVIGCGVVAAAACGYCRPEEWAMAVAAAAGSGAAVVAILAMQSGRRRKTRQQLPAVLNQLARALRAGLTLEDGLDRTAADEGGPLAADLRRCRDEVRLGLPAGSAFERLAGRVGLPELDAAAAAVRAGGRAGGDLPAVLDRLAAVTRERNAVLAQARAATATGRLSAGMVASAMPALLGYYLLAQPEFLGDFWRNPLAWRAVGLSAVLEVVGLVWVWALLRDDS